MNRHSQRQLYPLFVLILFSVCLLAFPAIISAQETATPAPTGTPIEISGVVSQIGTGTITVAGLMVDVSAVTLDAPITVGTTVTVTGFFLPGNIIAAQIIVVVNPTATPTGEETAEVTPELTPAATLSATPTPNPDLIVVIEGPVINIVNNIITIYNFDIEVEPANPILTIINIGDMARVEGVFNSSGIIIASVVSNIAGTANVVVGATVGLDGPIEAINGNIVIVNGIPVQFAPNDPRLATLRIGDFLNVQGNFQGSGTTIVLVVVNVTVINNVIINGNPFCWYHYDGMGMGMGHWHCDGMGMGDAGMGMGMGMGG